MNPPKIFISATSGDLSSARQIAKEALLTINCHPVEQTNFEPDWRSVTDMLRGKIGDCQALIHLVGFRYGAEPDPATLPDGTPRRSYTQMEYHLARELGLRVYTFLLPETYPFDVPREPDGSPKKPEDPELFGFQKKHRDFIQSSSHLYEKPANDLELRVRIIALQETVIALKQDRDQERFEVLESVHEESQKARKRNWSYVFLFALVLAGLAFIAASIYTIKSNDAAIETVSDDEIVAVCKPIRARQLREHPELSNLNTIDSRPPERTLTAEERLARDEIAEAARRLGVKYFRVMVLLPRIDEAANVTSTDPLNIAQQDYVNGKYPEAATVANALLANKPTDKKLMFEATRLIARCEREIAVTLTGEARGSAFNQARILFRQAANMYPSSSEESVTAKTGEAYSYMLESNFPEAQKLLQGINPILHPNWRLFGEAKGHMATCLQREGRLQEVRSLYLSAFEDAKRAELPDEKSYHFKFLAAHALFDGREYLGAVESFRLLGEELAAKANPKLNELRARTAYMIAIQYEHAKKWELAQEAFNSAVRECIALVGKEDPLTLHAMRGVGRALYFQEKYKEAEVQYQRVLPLRKSTLGEVSHFVGNDYLDIGHAQLWQDGRAADAMASFQAALSVFEKLPTEQSMVARTKFALAAAYEKMGDADDARTARSQAWEVCKSSVIGIVDPVILTTLADSVTSSAWVDAKAKNYSLAEEKFQWAYSRVSDSPNLGGDQPSAVAALTGLAWLDKVTEKYGSAEKYYREIWEKRKANPQLGPDAADTLDALGELAWLEDHKGDYEAAAEKYGELWDRCRSNSKLGPDHPDTLWALSGLANSEENLKEYDKAEAHRKEVWERRTANPSLGPQAPETLEALASLAWVEEELDKDNDAREHYTAVFEGRVKHPKFGLDHPNTLDALSSLAWLDKKRKDLQSAAKKYRQIWETRKVDPKLGPSHEETLSALTNLAYCEEKLQNFAKAEPLRTELWERRKANSSLGVEAPETLDALASLAWVEEELDKDNNAREHYTAVFEGRIKHPKFGRDHPETLDALAQLAWLNEKGHDFGGAAEKYREVWEKRKAHPNYGPEHKGTLWALDRLADCEDSQGKFQEAEPHRRELHEANQARVNALGKDDIEALNTLADYTNTLSRLGQGDQAIKLATELVERARRLLGKNDDWTQQIEKVLSFLKKRFPQATR